VVLAEFGNSKKPAKVLAGSETDFTDDLLAETVRKGNVVVEMRWYEGGPTFM
jgi:hypothetical protein